MCRRGQTTYLGATATLRPKHRQNLTPASWQPGCRQRLLTTTTRTTLVQANAALAREPATRDASGEGDDDVVCVHDRPPPLLVGHQHSRTRKVAPLAAAGRRG
jgi:hypothetical protein